MRALDSRSGSALATALTDGSLKFTDDHADTSLRLDIDNLIERPTTGAPRGEEMFVTLRYQITNTGEYDDRNSQKFRSAIKFWFISRLLNQVLMLLHLKP